MRLQLSLLPFFSAFLLCHGGLWKTLHWEQANFGLSRHVAEWCLWMNSEISQDFFISAMDKSRQTQPNAHLTRSPWIGASMCTLSLSQPLPVSFYFWNQPFSRRLTFTLIYINSHNLRTLFLLFLSSLDNEFILIGYFKQRVQCRTTRGVLKIEIYWQRLTHRACMGEASSYWWAPAFNPHWFSMHNKGKD